MTNCQTPNLVLKKTNTTVQLQRGNVRNRKSTATFFVHGTLPSSRCFFKGVRRYTVKFDIARDFLVIHQKSKKHHVYHCNLTVLSSANPRQVRRRLAAFRQFIGNQTRIPRFRFGSSIVIDTGCVRLCSTQCCSGKHDFTPFPVLYRAMADQSRLKNIPEITHSLFSSIMGRFLTYYTA